MILTGHHSLALSCSASERSGMSVGRLNLKWRRRVLFDLPALGQAGGQTASLNRIVPVSYSAAECDGSLHPRSFFAPSITDNRVFGR